MEQSEKTFSMDDYNKILITFLNACKVECTSIQQIDGLHIPRETLLNNDVYESVKKFIPEFKKKFSSSYLTSLQGSAEISQKWPLLNLFRQILKSYNYNLKPKRLSNGYSKTGKKLYKRIFLIEKI